MPLINSWSDLRKLSLSKGNYHINVSFDYLESWLEDQDRDCGLELNPDFQRGHVWTLEQRVAYMEAYFINPFTNRNILFNCANWRTEQSKDSKLYCVDGLQRITTILMFIHDEIAVFGRKYSELGGRPGWIFDLDIHINDLPTRKDMLQWYIGLNSGGTVHTKEELDKVIAMLGNEVLKEHGVNIE